MAATRAERETDGLFLSRIDLVGIEADFQIDPERDLLDYWEIAEMSEL
jgi:hypothetical protein